MLDIAYAHIPNKERTHLVRSTDADALRCDVFRVEYKTQDEANHELISTLTIRCLAHKVQGKHFVVCGVYETMDEKVRGFIDGYLDQRVTVTKRHFDYDSGETVEKKSFVCMFESGRIPYHCDLPDKPVQFELFFREI